MTLGLLLGQADLTNVLKKSRRLSSRHTVVLNRDEVLMTFSQVDWSLFYVENHIMNIHSLPQLPIISFK